MSTTETQSKMRTKTKVLIGLGTYLALAIALLLIFGNDGKNEDFKPQNEFKLPAWVHLKIGPIDLSINRAVFYLALASVLTIITMTYIAKRMAQKPNRVQTGVELSYELVKNNILGDNLEPGVAKRWFPFIATLFFFIWFSNMIGFIPLPTNTEETFNVFGLEIPSFAIYAATANISVPIVLTLVVWISYHVEGIRAKGFIKYLKGWIPAGVEGPARVPIFFIEVISQFVRLVSLSVRLFANILAGHLLILFMGGGLVVLLNLSIFGSVVLGLVTGTMAVAFFLFEVGLVATLQAFIFATLTAIYLGGAVAEEH
jgi:F-type H+-transporting ATPase subunit a